MAQLTTLVIDLSAQERLDRYQTIVDTLTDNVIDLATFEPPLERCGRVLAQRRPLG